MDYLPGIFALVVAAAGWFYLFYSRAAQKLSGVEEDRLNRRRIRLRRVGGTVMILLGLFLYILLYADVSAPVFMLTLLLVILLLIAIMVLGMIDLRLTWKLRRQRQKWDS
jgi:UDP-N-acetylmuramyl pentapeptide phosphotransferase/UDP-N-acetylglucosamine-1-phosphate transferase